jgi:hypothetical protein
MTRAMSAPHGQAVLQHAVRVIEEVDPVYADRLRSGDLLLDAHFGGLLWRAAVHTRFAAGQQQIGHLHAPRPFPQARAVPIPSWSAWMRLGRPAPQRSSRYTWRI